MRTARSTTFDLGDGRYRTRSYPDPVNYRDAAGAWQPIDNTLVAATGGWTNRAGPYRVTLPTLLSGAVGVSAGGLETSYTLDGAAPAAGSASGSTVTYPNALPATTVVYTAIGTGVKESLLLASPAAPTTFSYTVSLGAGLTAATTAGCW